MTTHLYAGPADWPETLCRGNHAWSAPEPAVYFCDLDRVTCADCLGRVEIPTVAEVDDVAESRYYTEYPLQREPDLVYILCWVVLVVFIILALIWHMT